MKNFDHKFLDLKCSHAIIFKSNNKQHKSPHTMKSLDKSIPNHCWHQKDKKRNH